MSSFTLPLLTLLIVGVIGFVLWRLHITYWHIGYGTVLALKTSDGTVWVASRLLGAPAHAHGIDNGARVVSVDGRQLIFTSEKEFIKWSEESRPSRDKKSSWVVVNPDGKEIVAKMIPRLITSKIPVYWSPNQKKEGSCFGNGKYVRSCKYCEKTGQYFFGGDPAVKQLVTFILLTDSVYLLLT